MWKEESLKTHSEEMVLRSDRGHYDGVTSRSDWMGSVSYASALVRLSL